MFLCCMATSFAQFSGSGSGTENDPYLILNPIQLNQMRNFLNKNVYFKLMADIDLTEFIEDENPSQGWQPIGTSSASFTGVFDGNGHTISGLWINRPNADYVGLFAHTGGSETITIIKNLILDNANVKGKDNIGLLIGYSVTTNIINCTISGSLYGNNCVGSCVGYGQSVNISEAVSSAEVQGSNEVGGIIGTIYMVKVNAIKNNIFRGSRISGNNYVGGICGNTHSTKADGGASFSNCYATSNVEGNNCVGGVCGQTSGKIEKCRFRGNVSANSYVGGICGDGVTTLSSTEECYAIAHIKGQGEMVGGLFGRTYTAIKSCYFCGTVIGNEMVGGLVGLQIHNDVEKSYSNSKISGVKYIGGLCGFVRNDRSPYTEYRSVRILSNVTILSSITASDNYVGRIYGGTEGGVLGGSAGTADENKAWNRAIVIKAGVAQDVEDDDQNGTGVSATTLKLKATYVGMGWDFNDIWDIQETECYPYFKTQTAPPVITSQVVSGATTISGNCVSGGTITLEIDGVKQQTVSSGNTFSFTVSPLQVGQEIWVSAKAEGKEPSYYAMATVSFMGKGTESDPYQVYTAGDLKEVYRKGYFKLMNDIDLTSYINTYGTGEGWEAIGRDGSETIYFDGNGHKITGLWCNTTRDNTGLFSCFANGYIKNLTVETASGKQVKGGNYTGIIIGKLINGEITNCKAFGTVADGTPVGGMIGKLDGGKLLRCQTNVTINVTGGNSYVGGLAGEITGDVEECLSNGTLTATGSNSYVGGLVGLVNSGSNMTNCYSNAKVSSSYNAAGLIAYNYGVVDKCYATGDLFSNNYGAGVIGYNDGAGAVVKNCAAMNIKIDLTYESQSGMGGGYGQRIIGGIKNGAPAPEMNNYALKDMQVSLNGIPQKVYDDIMNGTSKTGGELVKAATYQTLGWDFSETWQADEISYPSLRKNIAEVSAPPAPCITADDKARGYGDNNPELTYHVDGSLEGTPELVTDATRFSNVGSYEIVVKRGTVTGNYTSKNGVLTISKAPLTISVGSYSIKQGESLPTFTVKYDGFKNDETSAVLIKQPVISCEATENSAPGVYPITVSGAEAQNYEISYVAGTLTISERPSYTLTYLVDGVPYKTFSIQEGASITPEPAPTKEGYTFSGWSKIPETMPAHDVTVTGSFTINQYTITYMIDNEVYTTEKVDYGSTIMPPTPPSREGYDFAWGDYPETMPAYDITIYGTYTTGIDAIIAGEIDCQIFSLDGKPLNELQTGVNIVRMSNGQVRKVVVK